MVKEDGPEPEADRHKEINGDVEEAEKGKDRDEIGPLQKGREGDNKEGEGTCKEHVPLGIVEQDIAAVHGHTLQAEEDNGHAGICRDESHMRDAVDDEEEEEHRDGKGGVSARSDLSGTG